MRRWGAAAGVVAAAAACGAPGGAEDEVVDGAVADARERDGAAPDAGGIDAAPPEPPPELTRWIVGDPADAVVASTRGLILMGGGPDVDAAFAWQRDRIGGGDVVVLRASGADGYNGYLFDEIGGVDSVETLIVDTRELAIEPYVAWTLRHAEAIFMAGGDQAVYVGAWRDTPVADALTAAWGRGAVLGGTSAGCAVLGGIVYAAANGTVYSDEALEDPYNPYMTLERDVLEVPPLVGVVTDTHFAERDRMGRLVAFVARAMEDGWAARPIGLGVDEGTALVVNEDGIGTVVGQGAVYAVIGDETPAQCAAGAPLVWADVPVHELREGDAIALPSGETEVAATTVSAGGGVLTPADPY